VSYFDPEEAFGKLKEKTVEAISSHFPAETNNKKMVLDKVWVEDNKSPNDYPAQLKMKTNRGTWAVPIKGRVTMTDKRTGEKVTETVTLAQLPRITDRYSYIVKGNEYQIGLQTRLKPGAYTRIKANGELEGYLNFPLTANRKKIKIHFDPEKRSFTANYGNTTNINLMSILQGAGLPQATMEREWGEEIAGSNMGDVLKDVQKLAKAANAPRPENLDDAAVWLQDWLKGATFDPEATKRTLGEEFTHASGPALLAVSKKLLSISRQEAKPDDRNSLEFASFHGIDDMMHDHLTKSKKRDIIYALKRRLDSPRVSSPKEAFATPVFKKPISDAFLPKTFNMMRTPSQTNPLDMLSNHTMVTRLGKGGIGDEKAIEEEARLLNFSHIGFIDPLHTPESSKAGISLHLALGTDKKGNDLITQVYDLKKKKLVWINPTKMSLSNIVLPDQVSWDKGKPSPKKKKVKILDKNNELSEQLFSDADFVLTSTKAPFGANANLIPFLNNDQGNRASMATRQEEQAVALVTREQPLVQIATADKKATFEELFGKLFAHTAPVPGKVTKITDEYIYIRPEGKKRAVLLPRYNNFPLNESPSAVSSTVLVSVGDKVKKGQVIADTSFTKDGVLSLGTNLKVAYLPAKGYNYEDATVISETAAKKLTSEHLYSHKVELNDDTVINKKVLRAEKPDSLIGDRWDKLDKDGVIQEGQIANPDDILVAKIDKKISSARGKVFKKIFQKAYKANPVTWEGEVPGRVIRVIKNKQGVQVFVKTHEQTKLGDKVVGRHANKAIVAKILPDEEMPVDKEGKPFEILMTPFSIPSRINPGQVLETAAAKLAKPGKPFIVDNFDDSIQDVTRNIKTRLSAAGFPSSGKEEVFDSKTGKSLGRVLTGQQYVVKQKHQVKKKLKYRSGGFEAAYDINRSPVRGDMGGQTMDAMGMYALLSHGAIENIREMQTSKSDRDPLYWEKLMAGEPLHPPKIPFVYEKFESLLRGMGLDVEKKGTGVRLVPATDNKIRKFNKVKDPALMLRGKNLVPMKGGLFDPKTFGGETGMDGHRWGYFDLPVRMPNPVFEKPIKLLTDLGANFGRALSGKYSEGGITGPELIQKKLEAINTKKDISTLEALAKAQKGAAKSKTYKKLKLLKYLDREGLSPVKAYMISSVPVIPPVFRPVSVVNLEQYATDRPVASRAKNLEVHDINMLYKEIGLTAKELDETDPDTPEDTVNALQNSLYDSLKRYEGLGTTKKEDAKGIISLISGNKPPEGFFQKRMMGKRQDMSMRSTIIPEHTMDVDSVGLPEKAAREIFKPLVVREMSLAGYSPLEAMEKIKKSLPETEAYYNKVMSRHPVMMKRDPALHKHNVLAFKAHSVKGNAIKVHPLITGSVMGADFDGDANYAELLIFLPIDIWEQNKVFWESRRFHMTARVREQVGAIDVNGDFFICHLSEFPHTDQIVGKKDHRTFYAVPPGVRVVAVNEASGQLTLADVSLWSIHCQIEIESVTLSSGRQIITDDDERAVYGVDKDTLEWGRCRPSEASNQFVPIGTDVGHLTGDRAAWSYYDHLERIQKTVSLSHAFGYVLGALAGDGWVSHLHGVPQQVCLASSYKGTQEQFKKCFRAVFGESCYFDTTKTNKDKLPGSSGCDRLSYSSQVVGAALVPLIGKGAENKHLPPFFLAANSLFRRGLLSGLWDTDGSVSYSFAKTKPQFLCNFESTSLRLVQDTQYLLRSFGASSKITPTETPKGKPAWMLNVSTVDFYRMGGIETNQLNKKAHIKAFLDGPPPDDKMAYSRYRLIPLPDVLAKELRLLLSKVDKSLYNTVHKTIGKGYLSKPAAKRVLKTLEKFGLKCLHPLFPQWKTLVEIPGVHFERVTGFERTGIREDGYDLTVPGFETFMSIDGVVLSNTVSVFVPVQDKAVEEAWKMTPSQNLLSPQHGGVMYEPEHEAAQGLYEMSKWGKKTNKRFNKLAEMMKEYNKGSVKITEVVTVNGKQTTPGRQILYQTLPQEHADRLNILHDPNLKITTGEVKKVLQDVAENNPGDFGKLYNSLLSVGNDAAYQVGISIGLDDITTKSTIRRKHLNTLKKQLEQINSTIKDKKVRDEAVVNTIVSAMKPLEMEVKKKADDGTNTLMEMSNSGAKGNWGQIKQIISAPLLVSDPYGQPIPQLITRTYSEGMDVSNYLAALHGARKGTLTKQTSTQEPGALTKQITAATISTLIKDSDCETQQGISMKIGDDDDSIVNRYAAKDIVSSKGKLLARAGEVITPATLTRAKNNRVKTIIARSPMRCEHGEGVCQKCMGRMEGGQDLAIGTNVGVRAAHSLGEPGVNLSMKSFHSGGVWEPGKEAVDAFGRIKEILIMPKTLKGAAVLAREAGLVNTIVDDPAGGSRVSIGQSEHYVPANRELVVDKGSKVSRGQAITKGKINPHHLLPLAGTRAVQQMIANDLHGTYKKQGINIDRRHTETIARSMTNVGEVTDPGTHPSWEVGDFVPMSKVIKHNKDLQVGWKPIKARTILRGRMTPLDMQEDWIAKLQFERLQSTLTDAAAKGHTAQIHGEHPVPGMAFGKEFGQVLDEAGY